MVEDGYEFFAKRQLVTLFSAPNYCGEFDNAGGMMSVDETLMCSFQVFLGTGTSTPANPSMLENFIVTENVYSQPSHLAFFIRVRFRIDFQSKSQFVRLNTKFCFSLPMLFDFF